MVEGAPKIERSNAHLDVESFDVYQEKPERKKRDKASIRKRSKASLDREDVFEGLSPKDKKYFVNTVDENILETEIDLRKEETIIKIKDVLEGSTKRHPVSFVFDVAGEKISKQLYFSGKIKKVREISEDGRAGSMFESIEEYLKSLGGGQEVLVIAIASEISQESLKKKSDAVVKDTSIEQEKENNKPAIKEEIVGTIEDEESIPQQKESGVTIDQEETVDMFSDQNIEDTDEILTADQWSDKIHADFSEQWNNQDLAVIYETLLQSALHSSKTLSVEKMKELYGLVSYIESIQTNKENDNAQVTVEEITRRFPGLSKTSRNILNNLVAIIQKPATVELADLNMNNDKDASSIHHKETKETVKGWRKEEDAMLEMIESETAAADERSRKEELGENNTHEETAQSTGGVEDVLQEEGDGIVEGEYIQKSPETKGDKQKEKEPFIIEGEFTRVDNESEKFEALRKQLDEARKDYAEVNYKYKNLQKTIKNFFGKYINQEQGENENSQRDLNDYFAYYQDALLKYKQARLNDIEQSHLGVEDRKKALVEVLKELEFDERIKLYDARRDAETPPALMEKVQNVVEWYRSLPTHRKVVFSATLMGSGAAIALVGTPLAGAIGATVYGLRRGLGSAVAGRGTFQFLEAWEQSKQKKREENVLESLQQEDASGNNIENSESSLDALYKRLDKSIEISNKTLDEMMKGRNKRAITGIAVGIFLVSGSVSWLSEKLHLNEIVSSAGRKVGEGVADAYQHAAQSDIIKIPSDVVKEVYHNFVPYLSHAADSIQSDAESLLEKTSDAMPGIKESSESILNHTQEKVVDAVRAAKEMVSSESVLKIESGSGKSIEGELIKRFVGEGHSKPEAGHLAHRAVLDYLHEHRDVSLEQLSHVSSGEITLGADGISIENIDIQPLHEPLHSVGIHERVFTVDSGLKADALRESIEKPYESVESSIDIRTASQVLLDRMQSNALGQKLCSFTDVFSKGFHRTGEYFVNDIGFGSTYNSDLNDFRNLSAETINGKMDAAKNISIFYSSAIEVLGSDRVYVLAGNGGKNFELMAKIVGIAEKEGKGRLLREVIGRNFREI